MFSIRPSNHVDVQVGHRVFKGEHGVIRVVFAAQQALFFTHHIHKQHAASRAHAVCIFQHFELAGEFHHRHGP